MRSLGTLGSGNHFIEIDKAADGTKYLIIHSGSRNLGKQVADLYQRLAINLNRGYGGVFSKKETRSSAPTKGREAKKKFRML